MLRTACAIALSIWAQRPNAAGIGIADETIVTDVFERSAR